MHPFKFLAFVAAGYFSLVLIFGSNGESPPETTVRVPQTVQIVPLTQEQEADREAEIIQQMAEENASIYLWTRSDRFFHQSEWPDREELKDMMVVHGHTPRSFEPEVFPHRINVDTGAVFGGPLTAVMLKEGERPEFLRAS